MPWFTRGRGVGWAALVAMLAGWLAPAGALGVTAARVLRYHGYRVVVPSGWPVYRLATDPTTCVRFDRHAVYLGQPSSEQRCPAHAVGRTESIWVAPLAAQASGAAGAAGPGLPSSSAAAAIAVPSSPDQLVSTEHGVVVTATWSRRPGIIRRALEVRSVAARPSAATGAARPSAATGAARAFATTGGGAGAGAGAVGAPAAGAVYAGLGFDACATPSSAAMSAWSSSPYRAVGVYIGGVNMACSQPNLTSGWVSRQFAAGWHLMPIYVGLQAPSNSCGCASISSADAAGQGTVAARDAVLQAQAIGLGPASPIYDDMEAYTRNGANTPAVLAFLSAWTATLHAAGYQSGVYSSDDSGIRDLVAQQGTGYPEPDDIWIANWNGDQTTSDHNVPGADWAAHQRLHQYAGSHDASYGGVTLNVDDDYLDGATAAAAPAVPAVTTAPTLSVSPGADGTVSLDPTWPGAAGLSSWQLVAGATPSSLTAAVNPISVNAKMPIAVHSAPAYFAVRALGSGGQVLGSSVPVATPAHAAIFGHTAFVAQHGLGGLPVGCLHASPCRLTTSITAGATRIARTGPEQIPAGGGLAYFSLSALGHALLARPSRHRLAVTVTVRNGAGASATRRLNLIPFVTSGAVQGHGAEPSSVVRIIGTTDFVSAGWLGGILAACGSSTPCSPSIAITAAGQVIARTGPQPLGVNELGYLWFKLTAAGHALLAHAPGNHLPATLKIATAGAPATAQIALASFR